VDDPDERNAWKEVIIAEFGSSGSLPQWQDGSQLLATDVVGQIVEVEQAGGEPRRGVVVQFCDTGMRSLLSKQTGLIKAARKSTAGQKVQSIMGATKHVIRFDDTAAEEEVTLARENNGQTPFRVAMNPSIVQAIASEIGSIGGGSRHVALRWKVQDRFKACEHKWDVELRGRQSGRTEGLQEWQQVLVKPPPVDTERSASLFDLGSLSEKPDSILVA
jgi:hypothetical protein